MLSQEFTVLIHPQRNQFFILAKTCVVGVVRWEVEKQVRQWLEEMDVPANCPPNQLVVVPRLRSTVIHWAHASPLCQELKGHL